MGLPHRCRRTVLKGLTAVPALAAARSAGPALGALICGRAQARLGSGVWDDFRRRFVTRDGRVLDDDGATHSEGLGTALIASAAVGDRGGFERIWGFARGLRRDDGLFSWRVHAGGRVIDANNASDGDLYIAWALARAATAFESTSLADEARHTARALRAYCVRESRHGPVLVPGRSGFDRSGSVIANPSYWVFPAFDALAALDPHPLWKALQDTALALLTRTRFGPRGLTADWIEVGQAVQPWRERPARFGYEAIRVPLFLYWGQHLTHPQLATFARYAAAPAFPAWVALDSDDYSTERAPAGFEAIARIVRVLPSVLRVELPPLDRNYYSSSLSLLAGLANDDVFDANARAQNAANTVRAPTKRGAVD